MSQKLKILLALVIVAAVAGAVLLVRHHRAAQTLEVTLKFSVAPADQMDFVIGQASSAKLKYDVGKLAGVPPSLAQHLTFKPVPNLPWFEVHARVATKEEAKLFVPAFVSILQERCAGHAAVVLTEQVVR